MNAGQRSYFACGACGTVRRSIDVAYTTCGFPICPNCGAESTFEDDVALVSDTELDPDFEDSSDRRSDRPTDPTPAEPTVDPDTDRLDEFEIEVPEKPADESSTHSDDERSIGTEGQNVDDESDFDFDFVSF